MAHDKLFDRTLDMGFIIDHVRFRLVQANDLSLDQAKNISDSDVLKALSEVKIYCNQPIKIDFEPED